MQGRDALPCVWVFALRKSSFLLVTTMMVVVVDPGPGMSPSKSYSSSHRLNSLSELAYPVPVTVLLLFGSEALQLETCDLFASK